MLIKLHPFRICVSINSSQFEKQNHSWEHVDFCSGFQMVVSERWEVTGAIAQCFSIVS